jgi:hypothetical protein
MTNKINIDLHCHTSFSSDSIINLGALIEECDRKGIAKIAITDHNNIDGALEAASRWPERIIPGVEIMTNQGELLGYYVSKHIPSGLSPLETISALKAQNAIISVSHPFDRLRNGGWKTSFLIEILPWLDAIEGFNAHCFSDRPNIQAITFCQEHHISITAGSDAHYLFEIGLAGLTLDEFDTPQEFKLSLKTAQFFGRRTKLGARIFSRLSRVIK